MLLLSSAQVLSYCAGLSQSCVYVGQVIFKNVAPLQTTVIKLEMLSWL